MIRRHGLQWAAENSKEALDFEHTAFCCLLGQRIPGVADEYRKKADECWVMAIAGLIAEENGHG